MATTLSLKSATRSSSVERPKLSPYPRELRTDRRSRWSALDGIRALAVTGVILYHAGVAWIPGGLLGVDVFFVLSGFLITSLLLREVRGGGRVDLSAFWIRRARRLLPALLAVLIAVSLWVALDPAQDIRSVRLDVTSALFYVANWRFAFSHQGYFASTQSPSPVLHLWSLGVEEQFYLFWPLLLAAAVAVARLARRQRVAAGAPVGSGRRAVFVLAFVGMLASTAWLVYGSVAGYDASRLYYGTDTRVLALLAGAVLATVLPLPRDPGQVLITIYTNRRWTLIGLPALAGLAAIFALVGGQDRLLYRGGFLVVALLVAVLIAALVRAPYAPLSRLLGCWPLAHVGRISYGLYLWHWPVILFMTAARTHLAGGELLAARLLVALTLAEVSYWLMERPILAGTVRGPRLATLALVGVVGLVGVAGPWTAVARNAESGRAEFASKLDALAKTQETHSAELTHPKAVRSPSVPGVPTASGAASAGGVANSAPAVAPPPVQLPSGLAANLPAPVPPEPLNALLVGDSTAFSAALALYPQQQAWKVNLTDASRVGCGIAPGIGAGDGDQAPVKYGECWDWQQRWAATVAAQQPAISLLVLGHWEVVDRKVGNTVMHIGQPVYDNLLHAEFEKVVATLGSQGGKVALATAPCYLRPERPDGTRWPQDDCRRVQAFNSIVWSVAAEHPSNVVVLDLYNDFSADGKWHLDIGGHQIRDVDGIHFNPDAGQALAPYFFGGLRTLVGLPAVPQPAPQVNVNAANGG